MSPESAQRRSRTRRRRFTIPPHLGIRPSLSTEVRRALETAFARAPVDRTPDDHGSPGLAVLDAGCGGSRLLARYRGRIGRLVGLDVEPPARRLSHLDEFVQADLCSGQPTFAEETFDIAVSKFTVEHFADPRVAFRSIRRWMRPGGTLVLVTVNRRHPFVAAYLDLPTWGQAPLQRLVKAGESHAHHLVGGCNDPRALRAALAASGFEAIEIRSVGHLSVAWGRWLPGFVLGLIGDLAAQPFPARRSTLVISARAPAASGTRPAR